LFVKNYFSSVDAGFYAAASVIGKIILFTTGAFLITMFPKASYSFEKKEDSSKILKSTLLYTILVSFFALIIYYSVPAFISNLLFGKAFEISSYIGIFGLVISIFSVANVLVSYNLAVHRTSFVYPLIPLLVLEIVAIIYFHHTLLEVIQVMLAINAVMLVYMLFVTKKTLTLQKAKYA
jgi:O-antigen/teichoic acid export membrane protein